MDVSKLLAGMRIVPVVVIEDPDSACSLAECFLQAGIKTIEVTLRTDTALESIRRIAAEVPDIVVGAGSFVDEMIAAAGARNLASEWSEPYPRVTVEWLIASAPELILDASDDPVAAADYWRRWPSIPAVANGRALLLPPTATFPGPFIERALRAMALQIHPEAAPVAAL